MGRNDASFGVKHPNVFVSMKIWRDVRETTDLYKLCCAHYRHLYIYAYHWTLYRTQPCLFHGCFFEYLPIFLRLQDCGISLTSFKEFRTFLPCSFVDPLVKGTNNFCKIRGLIDGFNKSRRKITSGKENPQMSQWVPYDSVPPLKDICRTTPIYLGSWIHWGQRWRKCRAQGWG